MTFTYLEMQLQMEGYNQLERFLRFVRLEFQRSVTQAVSEPELDNESTMEEGFRGLVGRSLNYKGPSAS